MTPEATETMNEFHEFFQEYVDAAEKECGDQPKDKVELFALVMTMSSLYEKRINSLEGIVAKCKTAMDELSLKLDNLGIATTNNYADLRTTMGAVAKSLTTVRQDILLNIGRKNP